MRVGSDDRHDDVRVGIGCVHYAVKELDDAVGLLPEPERNVIRLRFGLAGTEPLNLRQTGIELGIPLGKARELEQQGLSRLATSTDLEELRRAA